MTDEERLDAYLWHRLAALLVASEIPDVEPLSMAISPNADAFTVTVRSRSRGLVAIGAIDRDQIDAGIASVTDEDLALYHEHERDVMAGGFELMRAMADILEETFVRKPKASKVAGRAQRVARAVALRAENKSVPRIAQIMTAEGHISGTKDPNRTVRKWLAGGKSRADRDRAV